jgi:hypothetical protein
MSLDWGGVKNKLQGLGWVALVDFEPTRERLVRVKGDDCQQRIAGQREILRGVDAPVPMVVLLPKAGVAFVVIEVLHAPVAPDSRWDALAFTRMEAG